MCFRTELGGLPPGVYTQQRLTMPCFRWCNLLSHVKHTCKSIEWTCPSVISLLIMAITIKIQSHSSLVWFYSLTVKVQPNQKLNSARGLQKLNRKFHYVNFIKLGSPISKIYLVRCHSGKKIIWIFFIENDFI